MKEITLSEATLQRLFEQAVSFEDSAETVIKRLLDLAENAGLDPGKREAEEISFRLRRDGGLLPEGEYWVPILELLDEAGGGARGSDVIDALEGRLSGDLGPRDHDVLSMGEVRWRNRARFARLRMKERGLISSDSPRGIWEITDDGRAYLANQRDQRAKESSR
jgi:hypothetical protein